MNSRASLRIAFLFLGLSAASVSLLLLPDTQMALTLGLVFAVGVVCSFTTLYDITRGRFDVFEVIHPVCWLCFIYFGLSTLYMLYDPRVAYDSRVIPILNPALILSIAGLLALIYGYMLARRFGNRRAVAPVEVRGVAWIAVLFGIGFIGAFAAVLGERQMLAGSRVSGAVSLFQPFEFLIFFAYFLLSYLLFRGRATLPQKLLLLGVVLPVNLMLVYLKLGNKTFALTVLGLPIIAAGYARGRIPAKSLVAMLLVTVFLVFPFFATFRNVSRNYSVGTRVSKAVDTLSGMTPGSYTEQSFFIMGQRLALINSVAVVLAETGRTVDYAYGRTIGLIFVSLAIPRILWPDKPTIGIGREFGRTFRILPRWDQATYVSITPIGEWYWNFGVPGVLFGMFLLGVLLQMYYRLGMGRATDPLRLAMYVSLLPTMMTFEQGIAGWAVGIIRALAFYLVLVPILRSNRYTVPARAGQDLPEGAAAAT